MVYALCRSGGGLYYLPEPLMHYRTPNSSETARSSDLRLGPVEVLVFNDAEYVAPLKFGESNRYVLTADAGIRANLTKSFFTEFKVVYHRNDHPVPRTLKDDLAYLLGVGWQF